MWLVVFPLAPYNILSENVSKQWSQKQNFYYDIFQFGVLPSVQDENVFDPIPVLAV